MADLLQAAETFIYKNLGAVLKSSDFLQFNVDDAMAMLKLESEQVQHVGGNQSFVNLVKRLQNINHVFQYI